MITTDYMIADCDRKRRSSLQKKINLYRSVRCIGNFGKEVDLLERTWLEHPEAVLVYTGDRKLNAYSALKRIKEVTPDVRVVLYSEKESFAEDAYENGADYFLPLPADDIRIGKLIFRYFSGMTSSQYPSGSLMK